MDRESRLLVGGKLKWRKKGKMDKRKKLRANKGLKKMC